MIENVFNPEVIIKLEEMEYPMPPKTLFFLLMIKGNKMVVEMDIIILE
jgi:hypothetical protein